MGQRTNHDFEIGFFEDLHKRMPKDVRTASMLAHYYTDAGRIDDGLRIDRKIVRLTPEDPTAHYNLACSLALKDRKADAVKMLRKALELGYDDFKWLCNDPDLKSLAEYSGFLELRRELGF
ncbi:MAG: tetratricopeptide repeat protein [Coraliomargarita sp.]